MIRVVRIYKGGYHMSDYQGKKSGGDGFYWLIALGLILSGFAAPIGVLMIVLKMLSGGKKRGQHPYNTQQYSQTRAASLGNARPGAAARPEAGRQSA